MHPSSTRLPVARPTRTARICSEAGDLVAVGWIERARATSRLELVTSIMAKVVASAPELVVTVTVRDRLAGPIPVVAVVADGMLVARTPLVAVPVQPGLGRVFHGTVILPGVLADGDPHEAVVSVTTRRSAEDDTVPDLAAAAAEPLSVQTLGFYAKRFARHSA